MAAFQSDAFVFFGATGDLAHRHLPPRVTRSASGKIDAPAPRPTLCARSTPLLLLPLLAPAHRHACILRFSPVHHTIFFDPESRLAPRVASLPLDSASSIRAHHRIGCANKVDIEKRNR